MDLGGGPRWAVSTLWIASAPTRPRYARKEQYLDDPDAGQIVTDEGCSPDQAS